MNEEERKKFMYYHGQEFKFDEADEHEMDKKGNIEVLPETWEVRAARGIVSDLMDRRGIKQEFQNIDLDIRVEIIKTMAWLISYAEKEKRDK